MLTVTNRLHLLAALATISLAGCIIAPAPSNTDWRKTPKVVLQVCSSTVGKHRAEIVFYRYASLGVATAQPVAQTEAGQDIYESTFEDPSPLHTGYGVHVIDEGIEDGLRRYFIFLARSLPSSSWSPWRTADTVEGKFPPEVDKFKKVTPLTTEDTKSSPKIRVRTEYLYDFDRTRLSRERYAQVPQCD